MSVAPTPSGNVEAIVARLHRIRLRLAANPVQRRAARRRLGSWIVVLGAAWLVHQQLQVADDERGDWGRTESVVVTSRAVGVGEPIPVGALHVARFPLRTVPDGALTRRPASARAAVALSAGQVLTDAMVDRRDRGAVASVLPAGTVGVVVSTGTLRPPVETGDRVDVVAGALDGLAMGATGVDPEPVARRALVVRRDDDRVTLAVRSDQAAGTATAALVGPVALLLHP